MLSKNIISKTNLQTFAFTISLLLSAFLLFSIQPMLAKALLPILGGSPSVWNICIVFYQSLLFLGYIYAHLLSSKLSIKKQYFLHIIILLVAVFLLPIGTKENLSISSDQEPTFWIISTLFAAIGAQYFAVSSTAPLMQRWFSYSSHKDAKDPYFLYSASNLGSLLALISYPFLIETSFNIWTQFSHWSNLFIVLSILIVFCTFIINKNQTNILKEDKKQIKSKTDIKTKLYWFILSFCPSSLMLGVTTYMTTDIASVPFLWIVPLTLYLLSFIIVFSKKLSKLCSFWRKFQLLMCFIFVITLGFHGNSTILLILINLLFFFSCCLVCHGKLANLRPDVSNLTSFYLIMSLGGACGGIFNSIISPIIFSLSIEYPIVIILTLCLRSGTFINNDNKKEIFRDFAIAVALFLIFSFSCVMLKKVGLFDYKIATISLCLLLGIGLVFYQRPVRFALYLSSILLCFLLISAKMSVNGFESQTVFRHRNFFGSIKIDLTRDVMNRQLLVLYNGSTIHGAQYINSKLRTLPLTYYHYGSPLNDIFQATIKENYNWKVALFGLGSGASACYQKQNQQFDYYEIDPYIIELAKKGDFFNYLKVCKHKGDFYAGDARISLKNSDKKYNLFVLDAFSSDSIPIHLLTKEAVDLYIKHLEKNGIIAFHISNRFFNLAPMISKIADNIGWHSYIKTASPKNRYYYNKSVWIIITKDKNKIQSLKNLNWRKSYSKNNINIWTDDFSNVFDILIIKDYILSKIKNIL